MYVKIVCIIYRSAYLIFGIPKMELHSIGTIASNGFMEHENECGYPYVWKKKKSMESMISVGG